MRRTDVLKRACTAMSTYTITFGEVSVTHRSMARTGDMFDDGLTRDDLVSIQKQLGIGELIDVRKILPEEDRPHASSEAAVLIVKNGVEILVNENSKDLLKEQDGIKYDNKAVMYGRAVNKLARHSMCFGEENQKSDLDNKKGTIVAFSELPLLNKLRIAIEKLLPEKKRGLSAQGNYYYDTKKCGIGYHGDSERKVVIGVRLGESIPLCFAWHRESLPVGERLSLSINCGDVYFMSEKACGNDWKKRKPLTLRHAAGCEKYISLKQKVKRKRSAATESKKSKLNLSLQ